MTNPAPSTPDEVAALAALRELYGGEQPPVTITLPPRFFWDAVTALQVAMRHPALSPAQARHMHDAGWSIQNALNPHLPPVLVEVLEKGWNPAHDQPAT